MSLFWLHGLEVDRVAQLSSEGVLLTVLYEASSFPTYSVLGSRVSRLGMRGNITILDSLMCLGEGFFRSGTLVMIVKYRLHQYNQKRPRTVLHCKRLNKLRTSVWNHSCMLLSVQVRDLFQLDV